MVMLIIMQMIVYQFDICSSEFIKLSKGACQFFFHKFILC